MESLLYYRKRLRTFSKWVRGKGPFHVVETRCPAQRFGSDYGGWFVGTDPLTPATIVYSLGIGDDITFDRSLIARYGMNVYAFDPTPRTIDWLKAQELPPQFRFHAYAIGAHDGTADLYPPAKPGYTSHTLTPRHTSQPATVRVTMRRLATVMHELGHAKIDVLKMDIEGAEYEVIEEIARDGIEIGQILVEFHHRFAGIGPERTATAVRRLRARGFQIFWLSPNCKEYCFIHSSLCR